ncbi:DNA cytosine methyltransferase [Sandarakinorhabdus sp.]|uniref:DNA cytosine methyltransferase n=1 Tax=Sandarakinorhabdus sp. TaxID=1916663 RepID=UPI00333F8614
MRTFYEFFAGGGMARAGLGSDWQCVFANDIDPMKAQTYRCNWGDADLSLADIQTLDAGRLPEQADLAWASFPCQDLSLAGNYGGIGDAGDIKRTRSGTFWAFWHIMLELMEEGRGPRLIVLENVYGILTAKSGQNFAAIGQCFADAGYRFGAVVIDAVHFVPQSRPRVFIIGVRQDLDLPNNLHDSFSSKDWHPNSLVAAQQGLSLHAKRHWIWWRLPRPTSKVATLDVIVSDNPEGVRWHTEAETKRLVGMMSPLNVAKLDAMKKSGRRMIGTIYRRTRLGEQRSELRCDGVAGCLRTPSGGSSRQFVLVVKGSAVRSRLLSAREAAKLMGLPDWFTLPENYNDAYHVAGDGVVVPVVRHLAMSLLEPILIGTSNKLEHAHAAE